MNPFVAFIFAYFILFAAFHGFLLVMAWRELRRHGRDVVAANLRRTVRSPLSPPISILVPAYNEEAGVVESVSSLLALEYPNFEIVVVSDGSTDATVEKMIDGFDLRKVDRPTPPHLEHEEVKGVYVPAGRLNLILIDKENGGKADALNAGINFSKYPLVCAIDADSVLEQDALVKTAMPFIEDPERTMVSGGLIRVANGCRIESGRIVEAKLPRKALPMFQVVEYLRAFFGARTGWSAINGLLIVSGAFGLFRKDAVIAAGGYSTETVGEDMELVVKIHRTMREQKRPYRVVYVPDPVCWTEAPESLGVLRKQRRRWHRGSIEALLMHKRMMLNPRYGVSGTVGMPAVLLFEIFGPILELSGYAFMAYGFATGAIQTDTFLLFLAICILYGLVLSFGAIALEDASFGRHPGWDQLGKLLFYAVLENFGYRQLTHIWKMEGIWDLVHGGEWGAMERKGLGTTEPAPVQDQVGLR
jgi:cellulose synthase/poly-beta-1,6-N-acetylglucosamine synthase-like glycosyltransferase